jgi:ABC-type glycerol-3-phosphate transport system permease component
MLGRANSMQQSTSHETGILGDSGFDFRIKRVLGRGALYLVVITLSIVFSIPYLWTVCSAFKPTKELFLYPPTFFPSRLRWQNFVEIWQVVPFGRWTMNSLYVTLAAMVGEVTTGLLVAYGFARFEFPGRGVLFGLCLSTMMLPAHVTIVPLFLLFRIIHWTDSLNPLIWPFYFGGRAFTIFLLRQFIMTIPLELDEAALIDGASRFRILWQIVVPLCMPALATAAIFSFMTHWNAFLGPLIFLDSPNKLTLPVGIRFFQNVRMAGGRSTVNLLMGSAVTITAPIIILFFFTQRYFIEGIVMSGIKG